MTKRTTKDLDDNIISEESFTYDAAGNITDAPDTCFAYDTNNRLTVFCGQNVSYDLDGNMLSNGSLSCTYDSANRLVSAGGHTYTYNAEDVRIRNLCADADTKYTYDTSSKLSKLLCKTTNGFATKYVYGRGLICEEKCGAVKIYHFDKRGSTVALTDINGNITDTFAYDTYGKLVSRTGTSFIIFGYNGRDGVITDKNGLIYMRARYYSPEMKRFVNADIVRGEITNAVTLNRYAYANANPVSNVDPLGLAPNMFVSACVMDGGGGGTANNSSSSSNGTHNSSDRSGSGTQKADSIEEELEANFIGIDNSAQLKTAYAESIETVLTSYDLFSLEVGVKVTLLDTGDTKIYFEITETQPTSQLDRFNSFSSLDGATIEDSINSTYEPTLKFKPNSITREFEIDDNTEISIEYGMKIVTGGFEYSMDYSVTHTDDYGNSIGCSIEVEHTMKPNISQEQRQYAGNFDMQFSHSYSDQTRESFSRNLAVVGIGIGIGIGIGFAFAMAGGGGGINRHGLIANCYK